MRTAGRRPGLPPRALRIPAATPGRIALLAALLVVGCVSAPRSVSRAVRDDDTPPLPGQPGGSLDEVDTAPAEAPASVDGAAVDGAAGGDAVDADAPAPAADDELEIHGSLITRARRRTGNGDRDFDLHTLLSASVGNSEKDAFSGALIGRMSRDLDGDQGADNSFYSLNDTYSSGWHGRLYEAYVDANQIEGLDVLRVGRQSLYDTPEFLRFDGALAVTEETDAGLQGGAYFGQTYHSYESSGDGDNVGGGFVQLRPWEGGRVRLDYMRLEDELVAGEELDHLLALRVWQLVAQNLRLRAGYSRLEGASRDAELAATWTDPDSELTVLASYKEQLSRQNQLTTEFDNFTNALLSYAPFSHSRLLISKGLGEHWLVEGGAEVRKLEDSADEGAFNHDFARYHLTGVARGVVADDIDVSLTSERWDADQGDSYDTWGADVTQQTSEDLRTSVGVSYARWKNDFLLGEERENARTWYARLRYAADEQITWSLGYDYEDNEISDFHTLTARMAWRF